MIRLVQPFAFPGERVTDPRDGHTIAVVNKPLKRHKTVSMSDFDWTGHPMPKKGEPVDHTPGFRTIVYDGMIYPQVHIEGDWRPEYEEVPG